MTQQIATIDFETRNTADSKLLKQRGAWNYSRHPATKILCLAYKLPNNPNIRYWYNAPAFKANIAENAIPEDLFEYINNGGLIEAHNVFFERCIWEHCAVPALGWPAIHKEQWRDSMAKCLSHSLPKALDTAAKALKLSEEKDEAGYNLMLSMTSSYAYDNKQNIAKLIKYCIQDVRTEIALSEALPDLSDFELKVWQEDFEMNWRGVSVDMLLADRALDHIAYFTEQVNKDLYNITGIHKTTQRARIKEWFSNTGFALANTQKEYLQILQVDPSPKMSDSHKKVISLMLMNNLSSLAKYKKVAAHVDRQDNRIRSNTIYHGGHTGRYTAVGVQLHNFPRDTVKNIDVVAEAAKTDYSEKFARRALTLGGAGPVLSKTLRGILIPSSSDKKLIVSDYAAIEARVLFWLAKQTDAVKTLAKGEDIYCELASRIFQRTITKDDKMERQLGKQAILGLGYGMGWHTFLLTLRKYGIFIDASICKSILKEEYNDYYMQIVEKGKDYQLVPENRPEGALCKYIVDIYRGTYTNVVEYWQNLEQEFNYLQGNTRYEKPFLYYKLPSGKELVYPYPKRNRTTTPWGEQRFEFSAALTHGSHFNRVGFYGGKLAENITQATAREVLVRAILNIANSDKYINVHHAHDEIIAEAISPDIEEFNKLMLDVGPEFNGCPLDVETHIANRWQKF